MAVCHYWRAVLSITLKITLFYVVYPLTPPRSSSPMKSESLPLLKAAYRDQAETGGRRLVYFDRPKGYHPKSFYWTISMPFTYADCPVFSFHRPEFFVYILASSITTV